MWVREKRDEDDELIAHLQLPLTVEASGGISKNTGKFNGLNFKRLQI